MHEKHGRVNSRRKSLVRRARLPRFKIIDLFNNARSESASLKHIGDDMTNQLHIIFLATSCS